MQKGLRVVLGADAENLANGAYGSRTIRDVAKFKRRHKIYPDGTIFGETAWAALQKSLPLAQRVILAVVPNPKPNRLRRNPELNRTRNE